MVKKYIPAKGDLVLMDFSPQKGREQSGLRPAIVLSPQFYNQHAGLFLVCPITSKIKGYPFEVSLTGSQKVKGVILSDHIKSMDWRSRCKKYLGKASIGVLAEVIAKVDTLIK